MLLEWTDDIAMAHCSVWLVHWPRCSSILPTRR
jgi:hypothetical protein